MSGVAARASLTSLGRYRLLHELGHGGMARVYVASSSGLGGFNKLVVLKVLREELHDSEGSLGMFLGEARLAARLNHPNVVQTLEVGEDNGRYFICMEYLEGLTLGRLMKHAVGEQVPLAARLELICQVLEALIYMHGFRDLDGTPLDLVHRDLSPNNVFVTFEGTAKVLDFGVAKAAGVSQVTEAGMFKGKLGYAAPEQIMGRAEPRSDVFAMGVVLWEVASQRRLSHGRTQQEIVQGRIAGMDTAFMREAIDVAPGLLEICCKAAAMEPQGRFASALEMRDALRAYMREHALEMSMEQLRSLLDGQFAAERDETRRLIDQRLKQAQYDEEHSILSDRLAVLRTPTLPSGLGSWSGTFDNGAAELEARRSARRKWALAGVSAAALAGAAWLVSVYRATPPGAAPSLSAPVVAPPALPVSAAAGPSIQIKIAASPADAQIYLDGAKLDSNPFKARLPKDAALHRLEVKCVGRLDETRLIRFDQDLDLLVSLQKDPAIRRSTNAAAPAPRRSPANAAKGTPLPAPEQPAAREPQDSLNRRPAPTNARPIDDSDPYGQ